MMPLKYFFFIFFCFKAAHSKLYAGGNCTLELTGTPGECKSLKDCPQLHEPQEQKLHIQFCGFGKGNVCCPTSKKAPSRKPGDKSKEKCGEYSKYIYTNESDLFIDDFLSFGILCNRPLEEKLLPGDSLTGRQSFPHMARVGYMTSLGNTYWGCGGSIISENYILTAARCLQHQQHGNATVVRIGVTIFDSITTSRQDIKISERIYHPKYNTTSYYNDIGLIKLEKLAEMSPDARPACLYSNPKIAVDQAIATGWGLTETGKTSDHLQEVTLDLFGHNNCNSSYANNNTTPTAVRQKIAIGILDDLQFCAGFKSGERRGTCEGDTGGPLQIHHTGDNIICMYDIIGVISFGKGNEVECIPKPGVNTRVSHYIEWIENIVWS